MSSYQKSLQDAKDKIAAGQQKSQLAELAKSQDPNAMMQFGANQSPEALAKYAEYLNKQNEPKDREIIQGADGRQYYADTQSLVLPNMETPSLTESQQLDIDLKKEQLKKARLPKATKAQVTVPGFDIVEGQRPTATDAKKMKEGNQAKKIISDQLIEYKKLVEKHGSETFGGSASNKMSQRLKIIQLNAKNLEELGALQAPDIEILEKMLPDATDFLGSFNPYRKENVLDGLKIYEEYIDDRLNKTAETRGYTPKAETKQSLKKSKGGWSITEVK